jgi:NADH-ubiquinone oxidoreductase chain 4
MLFSSGGVYFSGEVKRFSFFVVALALVLLCAFLVNNFFSFYFFFESSLVPTLFIIMGWGYQPERLQAGVYFLFYTLVASLPLLLLISGFYFDRGGRTIWFCWGLQRVVEFTLFFFMVLAFLVKMPIYFFHL